MFRNGICGTDVRKLTSRRVETVLSNPKESREGQNRHRDLSVT